MGRGKSADYGGPQHIGHTRVQLAPLSLHFLSARCEGTRFAERVVPLRNLPQDAHGASSSGRGERYFISTLAPLIAMIATERSHSAYDTDTRPDFARSVNGK